MFTVLLLLANILSWLLVLHLSQMKSMYADILHTFLMFSYAIPLASILVLNILGFLSSLLTSNSELQHIHTRQKILTLAYKDDLEKMSWLSQELLFLSKLLNTPYQNRRALVENRQKFLGQKRNLGAGSYGNCEDFELIGLYCRVSESLDQLSKDYWV